LLNPGYARFVGSEDFAMGLTDEETSAAED
jgi:hypothetical protein